MPLRYFLYIMLIEVQQITKCGRIASILGRSESSIANAVVRAAFVVIEDFTVLRERDHFFDMPIMLDSKHCSFVDPKVSRFMPDTSVFYGIFGKSILFKFNAQHDCRTAHCTISSDEEFMQQERHQTSIHLRSVKHMGLQRFIINTHSLHNGHLLRRILPRDLTQPVPDHTPEEHIETHKRISAELQVAGPSRRAEVQARAQSTWQRNKDAQVANPRGHGHGQATSSGHTCGHGRGRGRGQTQDNTGHSKNEADLEIDSEGSASDNNMIG